MTFSEMDLFLVGTIFMCCLMSVINAVKNKHRGWPGMILSVGFLVFAVTIYFYKTGASQWLVRGGAAILILLLTLDVILRAGQPTPRKKR